MLIKRKVQNRLYDYVHRGVTTTCIATTVIGTGAMIYGVIDYFYRYKPQKMRELERTLISEGAYNKDTAKTIGN